MVRHPDRVHAFVLQPRGIVGAQHALDDERPVPGVAQPFDIVPVGRGAQQIAHMRGGRRLHRRVGVAVHQPHPGHPVFQRAKRPGRALHHLRQKARRQARRLGQARPGLAFPAAGDRHVNGQDQRGKPRRLRAFQHVGTDAGIARGVHLEPAMRAQMGCHRLGRLGGDSGKAIGNVRRRGRRRQHPFRIGPEDARHADGRDAEGQGIGLAEHLHAQVRGEFPMQDRGAEQNLIQLRPVPALRRLRPRGAFEVFPDKPRHPRPCAGFQVGEGGVARMQVHGGISSWPARESPAQRAEQSVNLSFIRETMRLDCRA